MKRSTVAPKDAYWAGRKPVTLRYLFRNAGERADLRISVVEVATRRRVSSRLRRDAPPGKVLKSVWRGQRPGGHPARDGLYGFRLDVPGARSAPAGRFRLHGHRYPVVGAHGNRGPIGDFGAPRSGGRVHEGFDVTAPCGTPLLAIRAGRVERAGFDPELYGHFVQVDARSSKLDFFYAHMRRPASARSESVRTSERLGKIGLTGNAPGTPCHLHVELRRSGRLVDPKPVLARWDRYG